MFRDSNLKEEIVFNLLRFPIVIACLASFVFMSDFRGYGDLFGQNILTAGIALASLALAAFTFLPYLKLQKKVIKRCKFRRPSRFSWFTLRYAGKQDTKYS